MEPRFGSFHRGLVHGAILLFFCPASVVGCSGNRAVAPISAYASSATELRARAREFSRRGESLRAEEYYLAAIDAGAEPDEIYPELIDVCIQGGRLGRALVHVEARMRQVPRDLRLLRLAISLREGLGHHREALEQATRLAAAKDRSEEEELFLAGYFERSGDVRRALLFYRAYVHRTPKDLRPAWVQEAMQRLELLGQTAELVAFSDAEAGGTQ